MRCPRCKGSRLSPEQYDGENTRQCSQCRGFLIHRDKLARLCMRRTKSIDELMEEWNQQESIDVERSVRCPECLSTMERMSIPNSNQIPQDICRKCDLIWCDPGEIQIHLLAFISSDKGGEAERFQRRHELMTDHQKEMLEARINNLPTDHFDLIGALANYRHPRMRL